MGKEYSSIRTQGQREGTPTADWLKKWNISTKIQNPPYFGQVPAALGYIREYIKDTAYIQNQSTTESTRTYKQRIYATLQKISNASNMMQEMRITKMWPQTAWKNVWKNLKATPVRKSDLVTWYKVIHDIIPTGTQLNCINISPNDTCTECGIRDTLEHRLVECGEGEQTWQWTSSRIARMLRTSPENIPRVWLTRPDFRLWPTQCQRAVL